jgi:arylsulfatase
VAKLRKAYDKWWAETLPMMVNENRPYAKDHPQEVRYEKQLKERGIPDWVPPRL